MLGDAKWGEDPIVSRAGFLLCLEMQTSLRILVVDDDSAVRRCTAEMLTHFGYDIDTADDGSVALRAVGTTRYDILITDNLMKNMSGMEMVKTMRLAGIGLPVIMITGESSQPDFGRNPRLDAVGLLGKPFTVGELITAVQKTLSAKHLIGPHI
jgi:CheY-like chemotaxis protein